MKKEKGKCLPDELAREVGARLRSHKLEKVDVVVRVEASQFVESGQSRPLEQRET